jgi:hypothetical protein
MTLIGNLLLAIAALLYLVPFQIFLRETIPQAGHGAGGEIVFIYVTVPLWLMVFVAWCILLARGEFSWLGGGRGWQLSVLVLTWIALTVVTSLAAMLRGDSQMPWALRPFMYGGIHLLPVLVVLATFALLNPSISAPIPVLVSRLTLGICGTCALVPSLGMLAQWIVISEKKASAAVKNEVEFHDQNIRNILTEVEALDPVNDLGRLLGYTASNGFEAPRELAVKKIGTHPHLQEELALRLANQWSVETLGYLELNTPPDPAALAIPVRTALESLTPWIQREVASNSSFWPETYSSETRMALAVADKYASYGIDYVPAVRAWRAAFDHPKMHEANLEAPRLIDAWLAKHDANDKATAVNSRR